MFEYHEGICVRLKDGKNLTNFTKGRIYRPFVTWSGYVMIEDDFTDLVHVCYIRDYFEEVTTETNNKGNKKMKEAFYDFDKLKPFQRVHVYSPHVNDIHYGIVAQNANDKFIIYPNEPHYSCDGSGVSYDSRAAFKPNNSYKIVAVYEAPKFIVDVLDPAKYGELVWKDDTEERKQKLKELQERETKVLEELASIKAELRDLED